MKPIVVIVVFFSLMVPSLVLGYANYVTAKEYIIEDINQALVKTVLSSNPERITADTLRVFKSNLQISRLKETSYLSLCTDEPSKIAFCSDTVSFKTLHERLYIRAYPNCSKATIFSLSEQTIPGVLFAAGMLWGMCSLIYLRRKRNVALTVVPAGQTVAFGNLLFVASSGRFYNEQEKEEIYFTSMQRSFMKMLMASEDKKVSIDNICCNLWPGKENAKESLYTLVRRLKPIVESHTNLKIVADKGGYYRLSSKTHDSQ